jgi:hypothetical protein
MHGVTHRPTLPFHKSTTRECLVWRCYQSLLFEKVRRQMLWILPLLKIYTPRRTTARLNNTFLVSLPFLNYLSLEARWSTHRSDISYDIRSADQLDIALPRRQLRQEGRRCGWLCRLCRWRPPRRRCDRLLCRWVKVVNVSIVPHGRRTAAAFFCQ